AALSRSIGNIYTGSIYLGLASLLELQKLRAHERLCFGAYGSGCSALVFSARVSPKVSSVLSRGLFERLEKRREISLEEYELLHEGVRKESLIQPSGEFALAQIDHQGYRHYEYMT
ncbi:hydroxymethylglutaryl-CoA synthase, partial [Methanothrix sp.]|uniref:hydroxymethylglutaryl-CoA synthase n=1 Tax=Methanothrix sp. TaxID=90426 RepID=UPI003BB5607A